MSTQVRASHVPLCPMVLYLWRANCAAWFQKLLLPQSCVDIITDTVVDRNLRDMHFLEQAWVAPEKPTVTEITTIDTFQENPTLVFSSQTHEFDLHWPNYFCCSLSEYARCFPTIQQHLHKWYLFLPVVS